MELNDFKTSIWKIVLKHGLLIRSKASEMIIFIEYIYDDIMRQDLL